MNIRIAGFLLLGAAVLLLPPAFLSGYLLFQGTQVLGFAIALLGLNLITGYTGQISLGHGAFVALGGYAFGILLNRLGLPFWLAVPLAGAISFGVGFVFGIPALRLEGLYLALTTFALAIITPQLLKWRVIDGWTGGVQGIVLDVPDLSLRWLTADQSLYLMTAALTLVLFWIARNLVRGRLGRAADAIRNQPAAAATMGVDVAFTKTMFFALSAMYAGIAGAVGALQTQFVAPDTYNLFLSITLLVGIVVGGLGSLSGAVLGALFLVVMPNMAEVVSKAAPWAVYGLALILFAFFLPGGIASIFKVRRIRALRSRFGSGVRSSTRRSISP